MLEPSAEPDEDLLVALIVEDDVLLRMLASEAFRDQGFIVVEAESADQALSYLRAGAPAQMVFTDVQMPGILDGAALARALSRDFPGVRVVVTSGSSSPVDLGPGVRFIPKPYDAAAVAGQLKLELSPPAAGG